MASEACPERGVRRMTAGCSFSYPNLEARSSRTPGYGHGRHRHKIALQTSRSAREAWDGRSVAREARHPYEYAHTVGEGAKTGAALTCPARRGLCRNWPIRAGKSLLVTPEGFPC